MSAPVDSRTTTERPLADELATARGAAVRRLTALTTHDDPKLALRACEAIIKLDGQCRREDTRREAESPRAEARRQPKPPAPPVPTPAEVRPPAPAKARPAAVRADGTPLRSWLNPDG